MNTYKITNRESGQRLGLFEGENYEQAIAAMHRDAGYSSSEAAALALGKTGKELRAELLVSLQYPPALDAIRQSAETGVTIQVNYDLAALNALYDATDEGNARRHECFGGDTHDGDTTFTGTDEYGRTWSVRVLDRDSMWARQ